MLNTYEQQAKKKLAATVLALLIIAGVMLLVNQLKAASTVTAAMRPVVQSPAAAPATGSAADSSGTSATGAPGGYKDGAYSASSSYFVPHGRESIRVNVTLHSGVITHTSVQNSESNPTSAAYQQDFADAYKSYVVGQKLSTLRLGLIAGASDTVRGFAEALNQIADEARA